jgi:DNA-binding XRE family transcriptional regulator
MDFMDPEEDDEQDFLEELLTEYSQRDPDFMALFEAGMRTRQLLRALAAKRVELGLSLKEVAKRMEVKPSVVDSLERGELNPKMSLIERFAVALGVKVCWCLE